MSDLVDASLGSGSKSTSYFEPLRVSAPCQRTLCALLMPQCIGRFLSGQTRPKAFTIAIERGILCS